MKGIPLQVGSTGVGGDQHAFTAALNALLGTKLKPISGYPGTQEIMLAVERGELDGIVGYSWGVARSGNKAQLDDGSLKVILQLAFGKHKELPDVPLITDLVTNPDDRQVLEMIFSRNAMGRPVVAPPGVDPRVVDVLRKAFADTMRDPQFVAEGAKIGLELEFVSGDEVQSMVERLYRSPAQCGQPRAGDLPGELRALKLRRSAHQQARNPAGRVQAEAENCYACMRVWNARGRRTRRAAGGDAGTHPRLHQQEGSRHAADPDDQRRADRRMAGPVEAPIASSMAAKVMPVR